MSAPISGTSLPIGTARPDPRADTLSELLADPATGLPGGYRQDDPASAAVQGGNASTSAQFAHPDDQPIEDWFLVDNGGSQHLIEARPGEHHTVEAIIQAVLKNIVQ